jgi:hypothetical protein
VYPELLTRNIHPRAWILSKLASALNLRLKRSAPAMTVGSDDMNHHVGPSVSTLALIAALATVPAAVVTIQSPAVSRADVCAVAGPGALLPPPSPDVSQCADVLGQEARWLTAITAGDRETVESILNTNFKHIASDGKLYDRGQEINSMVKQPFTMNPSDQAVDIAGDLAVIHGVNTLTQAGKVLAKERFTDVFVNQDGSWMALSAQETAT